MGILFTNGFFMKSPIKVFIIILVIAAAVGAGAYYMQQKSDDTDSTTNANTTPNQNSVTNASSSTNTNTTVNKNTNSATNSNSNTNTSTNTNAATNTNSSTNSNTNTAADPTKRVANVYYVALEDAGANGDEIGCGDSVIAVEKTFTVSSQSSQAATYAALSVILANKNQKVEGGKYYNALYQSDLAVDSVTVLSGKATVKLTGTLTLGGTCDSPRVEAQLENSALQFEDVDSVQVYIDDKKLEDVLSTK